MIITRNPKREQLVLDQIRASFAKNDRGFDECHLSDLLSPRRSYWQRVMPLPPTNAEVLYWVGGRGHEDAMGRVAGLTVTEQKFWQPRPGTDENPPSMQVSYRPDFTFNDLFPGEFKTRRMNLATEGEEAITYESYLEQLRGYCAIEEANYGLLIVLSLLEGRSVSDPKKPSEPALACYDVFFTDEELAATREWLEERRDGFVQAMRDRDHTKLPLCKEWQCGKQRKIQEQGPYCATCDQEFASDATAKRHKHTVQPAVVRWEFEPRCKWYAQCRPQDVDPTRGERASA